MSMLGSIGSTVANAAQGVSQVSNKPKSSPAFPPALSGAMPVLHSPTSAFASAPIQGISAVNQGLGSPIANLLGGAPAAKAGAPAAKTGAPAAKTGALAAKAGAPAAKTASESTTGGSSATKPGESGGGLTSKLGTAGNLFNLLFNAPSIVQNGKSAINDFSHGNFLQGGLDVLNIASNIPGNIGMGAGVIANGVNAYRDFSHGNIIQGTRDVAQIASNLPGPFGAPGKTLDSGLATVQDIQQGKPVDAAIDGFHTLTSAAGIVPGFGTGVSAFGDFASGAAHFFADGGASQVANTLGKLGGGLINSAGSAASTVGHGLSSAASAVGHGFSSATSAVGGTISDGWNAVFG